MDRDYGHCHIERLMNIGDTVELTYYATASSGLWGFAVQPSSPVFREPNLRYPHASPD